MFIFSKRGFTLLELTLAMVLIAIVATAVFVSYKEANREAMDSQRKADMEIILGAQNLYYSHNDHFYTNNGLNGVPDINGYLTAPTDPGEGEYVWKDNTACDPDGEYFCAYAVLEEPGEGCNYETYIVSSEKGLKTICEVSEGIGFLGTGCNCW